MIKPCNMCSIIVKIKQQTTTSYWDC